MTETKLTPKKKIAKKATSATPKQQQAMMKYVACGDKTEAYRYTYKTKGMKSETIIRKANEFFEREEIKDGVAILQMATNGLTIDGNGKFHLELITKLGIENDHFLKLLLQQIITSSAPENQEENLWKARGALGMFIELSPKDTVEQLLITQMVATHNLALEMTARANLSDQTFNVIDTYVNRVTKLTRTFLAQVEALKKYRTGGKQTIQVQHVNVNEGGQAIVGNVEGGGGNG